MLPIFPAQSGSERWTNHTQRWSNVGHELQSSGQQGPERRPWHFQQIKPNQPQGCDSERVLQLGDDPVLKRAAGSANVVSEIHPAEEFCQAQLAAPQVIWMQIVNLGR
jgi:hypothetical protein